MVFIHLWWVQFCLNLLRILLKIVSSLSLSLTWKELCFYCKCFYLCTVNVALVSMYVVVWQVDVKTEQNWAWGSMPAACVLLLDFLKKISYYKHLPFPCKALCLVLLSLGHLLNLTVIFMRRSLCDKTVLCMRSQSAIFFCGLVCGSSYFVVLFLKTIFFRVC